MQYPVTVLCRVMQVSTSAYYAWKKRPRQLISADVLHLHRRMKMLFERSRDSLGSRGMMKNYAMKALKSVGIKYVT